MLFAQYHLALTLRVLATTIYALRTHSNKIITAQWEEMGDLLLLKC